MKQTIIKVLSLLTAVMLLVSFAACKKKDSKTKKAAGDNSNPAVEQVQSEDASGDTLTSKQPASQDSSGNTVTSSQTKSGNKSSDGGNSAKQPESTGEKSGEGSKISSGSSSAKVDSDGAIYLPEVP